MYFYFLSSFFLIILLYVYTLDGRNFAFMCTHKNNWSERYIPALTLYAAVSYDFVGI